MKNKLRKIVIDNSKYLYVITDKYHSENETNTLTLKVFLEDDKQSPLVLDFLTFDNYFMGQVLKSGVSLKNRNTDVMEIININEPRFIRKLILQALKNGWTGVIKIDEQNGLDYLIQLGYDTAVLVPL